MNDVSCLIISSSIDYSTDLVCYRLEECGVSYLRINRDCFSSYEILYDTEHDYLIVGMAGSKYRIGTKTLRSVYFRAPVFLRTGKGFSLEEQLYRSQWSSFIRNLIVFDKAKWVNHPVATYRAENKLYQLEQAKQFGLDIPKTWVGNALPDEISDSRLYIVKSLDTALFYDNGKELFTYSTMVMGKELREAEIKDAPVIIQECVCGKTDLRVTVVGDELYAVAIKKEGKHIEGDWRRTPKENLEYIPVDLPTGLQNSIRQYMHSMGLEFGGMDFALVDDTYYFIEVNPTGEWGWLVYSSHLPIDQAIVKTLMMEKAHGGKS